MCKFFRYLLISLIAVLLILCGLFFLLQSQWVKSKIQNTLTSYLQEAGIQAHISGLSGQLPFTWTVQEVDVDLNKDQFLQLTDLKVRFAIFPLLKGKIAVNYFYAKKARYISSSLQKPFSLQTWKIQLREQLKHLTLPPQITVRHFEIAQVEIMEKEKKITEVGLAGEAMIRRSSPEFAVKLRVFSPQKNETILEFFLKGNKKDDYIASQAKIAWDSSSGHIAGKCKLHGSWITLEEILYDLPLTKDPLEGKIHALLYQPHFRMPFFNRNWKCKSQFNIASSDAILVKNFTLFSDLIQIQGKGQLLQDVEKSKGVLSFEIPNLKLVDPSLLGNAYGKAFFQETDFKVCVQTQDLKIGKFAANTLNACAKGMLNQDHLEADVQIASEDADIAFKSSFAMEYLPRDLFSVIDLQLSAEDIGIRGYVDYSIPDHLLEGSLVAKVDHLHRLSEYLDEKTLNAKFALELVFSAEDSEQNVKAALVAKNMRYQEFLLDDLTISAEIKNLFEMPMGKCDILAQKLYTPYFYLDRLNFGTRSDETIWPFYCDVQGRIDQPFNAYAKGFWQKDNALTTVELTDFSGALSTTAFHLNYPCALEWGEEYLNLSPLDFSIGKGQLYATCELSHTRALGQWELTHFPLKVFNCFRPRFGLKGSISSSGFVDATPDQLQGNLNAILENVGITHFGQKDPFMAKGSCQIHLDQNTMQMHTDLHAIDNQFLEYNATLPILYHLYPFSLHLDKEKNISAELVAEGKIQDLFDFVNLGINHFTGWLSSRLFLSQTWNHPSLKGRLDWQNGSYENYFTGIHLKEINAQFEAKNDVIELIELEGNDDDTGHFTATGRIRLEPKKDFPYSLEAEMHQLHALGFDMIDCDFTGPLYLVGNLHAMTAQGNLIVDDAKIHLTERLPYEVPSLPVTYVHRPSYLIRKTEKKGKRFTFHLDLELTSEGTVRVTGRGLNAELGGNVHVFGTDTNIAAEGSLQLIKGEYQFSGKIFKLTEGEIIFNNKPAPAIYLNLNGTLNLPDITITAMLRGPLNAPQLTFQSNPQKPTSSILALILFNKDIHEISHPEAIQLASTLMSLSGGAGPDVLESIRRTIGIDRLNISSKPGTDELAVQVGKYLTRGVMITLSQSATSSQVIVEVELPKGFIFQAESQDEEEGKFSLKWRKSY